MHKRMVTSISGTTLRQTSTAVDVKKSEVGWEDRSMREAIEYPRRRAFRGIVQSTPCNNLRAS
jgi:hypothetical protein